MVKDEEEDDRWDHFFRIKKCFMKNEFDEKH